MGTCENKPRTLAYDDNNDGGGGDIDDDDDDEMNIN